MVKLMVDYILSTLVSILLSISSMALTKYYYVCLDYTVGVEEFLIPVKDLTKEQRKILKTKDWSDIVESGLFDDTSMCPPVCFEKYSIHNIKNKGKFLKTRHIVNMLYIVA